MFVYLDFPRPLASSLTLAGTPEQVIVAHTYEQVGSALREVQRLTKDGYYAVGYVSYEAAPAFDSALLVHPQPRLPLVWFALLPPVALEYGAHTRSAQAPFGDGKHPPYEVGHWDLSTSRVDYDRSIAQIHAAIVRGDTYQVNYTIRLQTGFAGDDFAYFCRLRSAQHPCYGAYIDLGRYRILSVSPELFLHRTQNHLTTKPMKGTVRRGYTSREDAELAYWLATSEKNRAENVMIVDLLRNDLGRVSTLGSVKVPSLFEIEKYPTVFQMTSTITAVALPNLTLEGLFKATFPCGSVTGTPKVSTMRLLRELEPAPREVYCGAIGVVCPDGEMIFNVAIRTVWLDMETGTAEYGVGGGITWDSQAEEEYEEALTKAAILGQRYPAFDLIETVLYEGGAYFLRERHLARLSESAAYFGFPCDEKAISEVLTTYGIEQKANSLTDEEWSYQVRIVLARNGTFTIEPALLLSQHTGDVVLHTTPLSRHNRFLYHNTTNRVHYEQARAVHPQIWDVLLWNEQHELMGFTQGNLILELDGHLYTPPLSSGVLAGVFRAELLETGVIQESLLFVQDLQKATGVWLINSVYKWIEVTLKEMQP